MRLETLLWPLWKTELPQDPSAQRANILPSARNGRALEAQWHDGGNEATPQILDKSYFQTLFFVQLLDFWCREPVMCSAPIWTHHLTFAWLDLPPRSPPWDWAFRHTDASLRASACALLTHLSVRRQRSGASFLLNQNLP